MLTFCEKCGNVMSLKEREGTEGLYECRACDSVAEMRVEKLILTEEVFEERNNRPFAEDLLEFI